MARLIDHFPLNLQNGSRQFGPAVIPEGLSTIIVRIARCTTLTPTIWPNDTTILDFFVEVSLDGGATWNRLMGATAPGGIVMGKGGVEATETTIGISLPDGTGRRARVTTTVTGGPLVSQLTVDAV